MKQIGLYEAKTTLSAIVAEIEAGGEPVALTRHGKVVAELSAPSPAAPKAGMLKSPGFHMAADFDEDDSGFGELFNEDENIDNRQMVAEKPSTYETKPRRA